MAVVADVSHCVFCFDSLVGYFAGKDPIPEFDTNIQVPMFVTWNKKSQSRESLRGCIGTFSTIPITSLQDYSHSSAFNDRRFSPITVDEIPLLSCGVSLLTNFEEGLAWDEWDVGTHGIVIEFRVRGKKYNATYLPEVAPSQGWDKMQTLSSLIDKAGFSGRVNSDLLSSISLTRYQSSKFSLTFPEYVDATTEEMRQAMIQLGILS